MEPDEVRARSGLAVQGAFAFGDSPVLADELLAFVAAGSKRATAGSLADLEAEVAEGSTPFPAPGQRWGLLDGAGQLRFVMETVEVTSGRLDEVTPAFAWDEGEYDRTREDWIDGHRRFFRRQGSNDPDRLEVVFERFRVVWPEPDTVNWLVDGVREARFDERHLAAGLPVDVDATPTDDTDATAHADDVDATSLADLPMLLAVRDGAPVPVTSVDDLDGALAFRPRRSGDAEVAAILLGTQADADAASVRAALLAGALTLGRRSGWQQLRFRDGRVLPVAGSGPSA